MIVKIYKANMSQNYGNFVVVLYSLHSFKNFFFNIHFGLIF